MGREVSGREGSETADVTPVSGTSNERLETRLTQMAKTGGGTHWRWREVGSWVPMLSFGYAVIDMSVKDPAAAIK